MAERPAFLRGVNVGARFGGEGQQWAVPMAVDYYMTTKGMNVFRHPVQWETLQPTLGGALDAAEVAGLEDQITRAVAAGGNLIIDLRNGQRRTVNGLEYIIGETPTVTTAHFADAWTRIATQWRNRKGVLFGLMNEPADVNQAILTQSTNAAISAVRATGATNRILASGNGFGNTWGLKPDYPHRDALLSLVDPMGNMVFDVHHYLDAFSAGTTSNIAAYHLDNLIAETTWARNFNKKLFLGEFAGAADTASLAQIKLVLDHVESNKDVWIGWTWWAGGGWWPYDYRYLLDPYGSKWDATNPDRAAENGGTGKATTWAEPRPDKPQMALLQQYLKQ